MTSYFENKIYRGDYTMPAKYKHITTEREFLHIADGVIKKPFELTPEELNQILAIHQERYLSAFGYRGITAEEYEQRKK